MEQQPQYSIEDLLLLKSQIEEGAKRRDLGIDPPIAQFDVPRETQALTNPNSPRDDYFASIFGPLGGEISRKSDAAVSSIPDLAYALSGLDLAADGGKNISEGMDKANPMRVAGGAAEVGLAALPFGGKALQAAYKTIPRAMGTGVAYGASPLVAAGVFSPEDAQAADEGGYTGLNKDNALSMLGPVAIAALTGGVAKGYSKNRAIGHKQEAVDLDRILANRERAQIVKDDFPIPNFKTKIDHELREIEPPKFHDKSNEYLAGLKVNADEVGDADLSNLWMMGGGAGALVGGVTDVVTHGDADLQRTGRAVGAGAFVGGGMPAFTRSKASKKLEPTINRYDPNPDKKPFIPNGPSDQLRLGRSPIAEAHPIEVRTAVEKRLNKGEKVKDLAEEYGIHESNLYRWKRKLDKKTIVKENAKKIDTDQ